MSGAVGSYLQYRTVFLSPPVFFVKAEWKRAFLMLCWGPKTNSLGELILSTEKCKLRIKVPICAFEGATTCY